MIQTPFLLRNKWSFCMAIFTYRDKYKDYVKTKAKLKGLSPIIKVTIFLSEIFYKLPIL